MNLLNAGIITAGPYTIKLCFCVLLFIRSKTGKLCGSLVPFGYNDTAGRKDAHAIGVIKKKEMNSWIEIETILFVFFYKFNEQ